MATTTQQDANLQNPLYQGYQILHIGFAIAPFVMGLDKFFNILTNWEQYLAPIFPNLLHISPHLFMQGVGIIEMIAGILTFFKPKIFAYVIVLWLWGVIINLLILHTFYDIAMRDLGLSLGALALARLSQIYDS